MTHLPKFLIADFSIWCAPIWKRLEVINFGIEKPEDPPHSFPEVLNDLRTIEVVPDRQPVRVG